MVNGKILLLWLDLPPFLDLMDTILLAVSQHDRHSRIDGADRRSSVRQHGRL